MKLQPWQYRRYQIVSWLDMLKFSATQYIHISEWLSNFPKWDVEGRKFEELAKNLQEIGCLTSESFARRMALSVDVGLTPETFASDAVILRQCILTELDAQTFFWMPRKSVEWYNKTGRQILGDDCALKFPKSIKEAESGARCFALEEWTASALHMIRCADIGVNALSLAIEVKGTKPTWGSVYQELIRQMGLPRKDAPPFWKGRERALAKIADPLRSLQPYRDEAAHDARVYDDKDAKQMMSSCPDFLRRVSAVMDENAQWV